MGLKIWMINDDPDRLLVVRGLYVVNGAWEMIPNEDGTFSTEISNKKFKAVPVMDAPPLSEEEQEETHHYNYNAAIWKAREMLRSREIAPTKSVSSP